MELLILLLLAGWGAARYGANGTLAHARNVEPLRIAERRQRCAQAHERAMAREARRTGPTIADAISMRIADRVAHPRGGPARQAIALWWSDSWGYATERRLLRHDRAAHGLLRRQKAARAVRKWLARSASGRRAQHGPSSTATAQGNGWRVWTHADVIREDPQEDIVEAEVVEHPSTPRSRAESAQNGETGDLDPHTTRRTPASPGSISIPDPGATDRPQPPEDIQKKPDAPPDTDIQPETEANLATVHPIRKDTPMTTRTASTQEHTVSSGEVLDPAAALAFVTGVKGVAERLVAEIELSVTSLRQCGVTGESLNLLTRLQEAFSNGAALAGQAEGHFQRHLTIQDQVLSDPDLAGTVHGTYVGTRS